MSLEQATQTILEHTIPQAPQRTNIVESNYVPKSQLFGLYTTRGMGITKCTQRLRLLLSALLVIASTRPWIGGVQPPFTSIQVTRCSRLKLHNDRSNHGQSMITTLGEYKGGLLWVEDPSGESNPPNGDEDE
eukprot:6484049-Amphidinium_carterae.1